MPLWFITEHHAGVRVQVLVLWFGQFPDGSESIASQLFAVAMATVGLGAFAIVLALVEQVLPLLPQAQAKKFTARGDSPVPASWAHVTPSNMMRPEASLGKRARRLYWRF